MSWAPLAIAAPVTGRTSDDSVSIGATERGPVAAAGSSSTTASPASTRTACARGSSTRAWPRPATRSWPLCSYDAWAPGQIETGERPCNYLRAAHSPRENAVDFDAVVVPPRWGNPDDGPLHLPLVGTRPLALEMPRIEPASLPAKLPSRSASSAPAPGPLRLTKVQPLSQGLGLPDDVAQSVDVWGSLILTACDRKPKLIVTPEIVIGGKGLVEGSVTVPGPAMKPFQTIARAPGASRAGHEAARRRRLLQ